MTSTPNGHSSAKRTLNTGRAANEIASTSTPSALKEAAKANEVTVVGRGDEVV